MWHFGWVSVESAGREASLWECLVEIPQPNERDRWDTDYSASVGITSPLDAAKSSLAETVYSQGSQKHF